MLAKCKNLAEDFLNPTTALGTMLLLLSKSTKTLLTDSVFCTEMLA
jgi:hypothetical protein